MYGESRSKQIYKSRVDAAIIFINEHLADDLNLEHVAQAAHFSPFHFHRIFTVTIGETPHEFINRVRLERAANMLVKMESLSITEIALACGFSSSATFARSFKKHFGVTASAYRERGAGLSAPRPAAYDRESEPTATLDVEIKTMPRFHVAYVSSLEGYGHDLIREAWEKLCRWADARDLITPEAKMLGISFDDPWITPQDKCRYYACITVPKGVIFDHTVGLMDIEGGKYAVGRLVGQPREIQLAFRFFYGDWLLDSGYQPADLPCYELYYATPGADPAGNYVVDICIPVTPL